MEIINNDNMVHAYELHVGDLIWVGEDDFAFSPIGIPDESMFSLNKLGKFVLTTSKMDLPLFTMHAASNRHIHNTGRKFWQIWKPKFVISYALVVRALSSSSE